MNTFKKPLFTLAAGLMTLPALAQTVVEPTVKLEEPSDSVITLPDQSVVTLHGNLRPVGEGMQIDSVRRLNASDTCMIYYSHGENSAQITLLDKGDGHLDRKNMKKVVLREVPAPNSFREISLYMTADGARTALKAQRATFDLNGPKLQEKGIKPGENPFVFYTRYGIFGR
jgi:hypothetical protein